MGFVVLAFVAFVLALGPEAGEDAGQYFADNATAVALLTRSRWFDLERVPRGIREPEPAEETTA